MKTFIKKLPKSQIEILFEISKEEFTGFIESAILELGKNLSVEGFRQGQVPKEMVLQKIGKEKILASAAQLAVKENYSGEISVNKFEIISQPEIEILSEVSFEKGLNFKALFTVLPEINLPDYKKIASQTKKEEISVKENEIRDALHFLQRSRAKFIFENRPAKKNDFIEIEFYSSQIENGLKRKDNFILGQGHFILGFEENLEGMAPGQEKEFSLRLPENYPQKDLVAKDVDFKVKMNSVQKMELPEVNDEWARGLGNFESLDSLKKSIGEGIKMEKENLESQRVRSEILEKIIRETKIEPPQVLVDSEKQRMIEDLKNLVSEKLKITFVDYLSQIKKTEKDLLDSFSPEAEKKIKYALILKEISKREKIEVAEKEAQKAVNEFLRDYPSTEKAKKEFDLEKLKSYYEEVIRNKKTLQKLESFTTRS